MRSVKAVILMGALLAVSACAGASGDGIGTSAGQAAPDDAMAACEARQSDAEVFGPTADAIAASRSTAGAVAEWRETRFEEVLGERQAPDAEFRARDAAEPVLICTYGGAFATSRGPARENAEAANAIRVFFVDGGGVTLDGAGPMAALLDDGAPTA